MYKRAGRVDRKRIKALVNRLRPGDLVNYEISLADAFKESRTRGLRGTVMTGVLGRFTGPQYHTAIVGDVDKNKGKVTMVETALGRGAYVISPKQFDSIARTHKLHFYRPNKGTLAEGRRAARVAIAAAGKKVGYPIKDLLSVAARDVAESQGKSWRGLVDRLDRASAASRKVSDESLGICSQLGAHAWGKALGNEHKFIKSLGVRHRKGSRIAVTPQAITKAVRAGRLKVVGAYAPRDAEKSLMYSFLTSRSKS